MHKLTLFEKLFNSAAETEAIQNLFDNTFDADAHKGNLFLKTTLPVFFCDLKEMLNIYPIDDSGIRSKKENTVLTMNYILRVIKFFTESGGEE